MAGIVAIVGRPNVGKSTLFNRLIGQRAAIVHEQAGVTRDRIYGASDWNGKPFTLIDTGGYHAGSDDPFDTQIRLQVQIAMQEADIILMVVDVVTGITDLDLHVANLLRQTPKKTLLIVNKVDDNARMPDIYAFYQLGLGDPFPLCALSGSGTGEILDQIAENLPELTPQESDPLPKVTIVGRPNVGKSSLINALLGQERNIVTPIAGTTRDAIDTPFNQFGHNFILVDTAGIRKKGRVDEDLEFYSVIRAIRAVERADVCVLVIDATRGFERQDQRIFELISKNRKAVVIVVNKWDLIQKDTHTADTFAQSVKSQIAPFTDVPILFTSARTKQRVLKILDEAMRAHQNRAKRIPTSLLNETLLPAIQSTPPPATKGKYIRIKYATQLPTPWPSFAFFCNLPQYVKQPYKRFLENKIREAFGFTGAPIQIYMRKK